MKIRRLASRGVKAGPGPEAEVVTKGTAPFFFCPDRAGS